MEVNINDLKKKEQINEIKQNISKANIKKELQPPKKKGMVIMNKPKYIVPLPREESINNKTDVSECRGDFKDMLFNISSQPIAKEKRPILKEELKKSNYLNDYIDNHAFSKIVGTLNDNVKALLVYGNIYLKVHSQ